MFASPLGRLLAFALIAIVILIALAATWAFLVATPYNRALVAITDRLSSADIVLGEDASPAFREAFESSYPIRLSSSYICVATQYPTGEYRSINYIESGILSFGMLLVIALVAATPALTWQRRLKSIAVAIVLVFLLHIVTILIFAKLTTSGVDVSHNPLVALFLVIGDGLFPAVIWGALSLRYWFPRPEKAAKPGKAARRRQ